MTVTITFETDNAAFADDFDAEVARTVAKAAEKLLWHGPELFAADLVDTNGNCVGTVSITEEAADRTG